MNTFNLIGRVTYIDQKEKSRTYAIVTRNHKKRQNQICQKDNKYVDNGKRK